MALGILAEAILRIEHKVDLVLGLLGYLDKTPHPQLHFVGTQCPVCKQVIDYQVDITHNVVVRKCGCKTGKQPSTIPLTPITGVPNASTPSPRHPLPSSPADEPAAGPPNRSRRQGR